MQSTFKYSFSIWLLAICFESLMYGIMHLSLGILVFILPFALLGGLPGLLLFHLLLKLGKVRCFKDNVEKLLFVLCAAIIAATVTTLIFLWIIEWPALSNEFPIWLILAFANLSAIISTLIFNQKITNTLFTCTHSEKKH